jgi:OPA family glycerol-3-phosphate transporter-like MFS transporter
MPDAVPVPESTIASWQRRIFALLWVSYASYYLCRMNFAAAQPEILHEFPTWTKADVGLIPSVYSVFYAVGQFVNGQLGSRFGARRMMVTGLVLISGANLLFSWTSSYPLMLLLWAINGYCQAIGWPLVVQTMSNWFRVGRRGTMMGLISTCYQGGNVLAWLLAGYLTSEFNWRAAFWVPGLTLLPVALLLALGLRNRPEDAGLPHLRDDLSFPPSEADTGKTAVGGARGGELPRPRGAMVALRQQRPPHMTTGRSCAS